MSLRNGGELGKGAVLFGALSGIVAVIIGVIFYREKSSTYQFVGMVLGIVAIVFLSRVVMDTDLWALRRKVQIASLLRQA